MKARFTRKSLTVGLVLGLALTVTGCNRNSADDATDELTLTLSVSTLNNPFFIELRDGAVTAAESAGVDLVVFDAQNDATTQLNQLSASASQQVDAVLINPVDSAAAGAAVEPVVDNDIPVIAVDRSVEGVDVNTTVSSDNVAGGREAADALAAAIGEEGSVITLQGVAGTSASRDRGKGFAEGIAAYPDVDVVASQPANFDRAQGLNVSTNLLESNPEVVGVFAENDEMALGAIQALGDRAGKDVFVVSFDGTPDGLLAIQDGNLAATVAQRPAELGRVAVEQALKAIDGEQLPAQEPVEVTVVDESNVEDFVE